MRKWSCLRLCEQKRCFEWQSIGSRLVRWALVFSNISASPASLLDPCVVCASLRVARDIPKCLRRCQISELWYRQESEDQESAPSLNFWRISACAARICARLGMHGVMALIELHVQHFRPISSQCGFDLCKVWQAWSHGKH